MEIQELRAALKKIADDNDGDSPLELYNPEQAHKDADRLLLDFIDDNTVTAEFERVPRYYI